MPVLVVFPGVGRGFLNRYPVAFDLFVPVAGGGVLWCAIGIYRVFYGEVHIGVFFFKGQRAFRIATVFNNG